MQEEAQVAIRTTLHSLSTHTRHFEYLRVVDKEIDFHSNRDMSDSISVTDLRYRGPVAVFLDALPYLFILENVVTVIGRDSVHPEDLTNGVAEAALRLVGSPCEHIAN